MTIQFQFTLDDYRKAFLTHYKRGASIFTRWMLKFCLCMGVLLLLVGVLFLVTRQWALNVLLPPLLIGGFWIWFGLGGTYRLSVKTQFAKNPVLHEPRRVEFTPDGVKTDAGIASSQQSWKAYLRYVESTDTFLLYTSPGCFNIVPKRVLQPAQIDELRELLKNNVGKGAAVAVS